MMMMIMMKKQTTAMEKRKKRSYKEQMTGIDDPASGYKCGHLVQRGNERFAVKRSLGVVLFTQHAEEEMGGWAIAEQCY